MAINLHSRDGRYIHCTLKENGDVDLLENGKYIRGKVEGSGNITLRSEGQRYGGKIEVSADEVEFWHEDGTYFSGKILFFNAL